MLNRFTQYVFNTTCLTKALPLMHTTDSYNFRKIIEVGKLEPGPCNVFSNDNLLYLFYGRPAYRVSPDDRVSPDEIKTSLKVFFPVCFVLKPDCIISAKRVFPFDSGAFASGKYSQHFHNHMKLESFLVEPDPVNEGKIAIPGTPIRIVSAFYGDNRTYYSGSIHGTAKGSPLDFEVECFSDLIQSKSKTKYDDRRSSIEIQIDSDIILSPDTIRAVVIPMVYMEDTKIREIIIGEWGAEPILYEIYHSEPSQFTLIIMEKVKHFLETEDLF